VKQIGLLFTMLLVGLVAVVAFTRSPKVHEAAPAPIDVTALEPAAPTLLADPLPDDTSPPPTPVHDEAQALGCEAALRALGVRFAVLEPITGEDGCGAERPLTVSSVGIELKPAVTTRCEVARALALWTRNVLLPSATLHLKATPIAISTGDSYQCRSRRGDGESKVSEHAHANAIDIAGISFSDRDAVPIMDRPGSADDARAFRAAIRGGACAYFTTVLGPGTDAAHADHLHFDLIERRNGYRICE